MRQYERRVTSQFGEDGIIEYLINTVGVTNKIAVEIGTGPSRENNTHNLLDKGWRVFWFDLVQNNVQHEQLVSTVATVTSTNVVELFDQQKIPADFDLLSIDIDGNDYHVRQALAAYKPRIIVMEYNGAYDKDTEYIMPLDDSYRWQGDVRFNASLKSLQLLNDSLGYDLVYCTSQGVNAFFLRKDINPIGPKTCDEVYRKLFWYKGQPITNS